MLMRAEHRPVRRVLMTADAVGGVWTYALDLASGLRERGIDVTIALMGPPPSTAQRRDARRRGLELIEAPFRLEWMPDAWSDVDRAGEWLLSLAECIDPDVVHLNGYCHAPLRWPVPVMVVAHSCVRTWWRGVHGHHAPADWDEYTARVTAGLHAADVVVAPTRALLDDLEAEYGTLERSRVIPNGSRRADTERGAVPKEPVVLSAGRLWDEAKNIAAVCAAAPHIRWRTFVAGDPVGPTGVFGGSGAVCCLGRLDADALEGWLERASIYALPARYEPFGLSIVEAAAAGCALVLGDIRTLRENWNGAAVFVPPDNRRALARAIDDLIEDEDRRQVLATLARDRSRRFSAAAMSDAYVDAYNALLAPAAVA